LKNQHFGENRDLLKFDLVTEVLKSGLAEHFLYVPMLTPDGQGKETEHICRHESTGGGANAKLMDFLDYCVVNDKRQVSQLENYFNDLGYSAQVYAAEKYLTAENRESYFEEINWQIVPRSLVLIDPDMGLEEVADSSSNLKYAEIQDIYNALDDNSILMFTQKFPYEMYTEYLEARIAEIKNQIPSAQPVSLDDLDSIIFFLPKSTEMLDRLVGVLQEYTQKYYQKADAK